MSCLLFLDGIPEMFDGAEVNEAEVLAWISKELSTNEVKPTSRISIDMVDYFLVWSKLFSQIIKKKSNFFKWFFFRSN